MESTGIYWNSVFWCHAFVRFHGTRHPLEVGGSEVEALLGWLASDLKVATSAQ